MTLDDIALRQGTDKGSTDHNYCPYYERYLEHLRDEPITLVEIGVWQGASLRMWREYFSKATIIGVDNIDRPVDTGGAEVVIADQSSKQDLDSLRTFRGPFDVVIDDGSHVSSLTINTFEMLWPALNPGGLYVVEDLQTSYDPENYSSNEASRNPDAHLGYSTRRPEYTAMQFCKRLADEVNRKLFPAEYWWGHEVESVQFFQNICFIVKAS
jgi:8-demethyl-8-(2-methoxy-alpha-L-rhamnosyl)tetracenomycin-C 3'-O-methyltransferase